MDWVLFWTAAGAIAALLALGYAIVKDFRGSSKRIRVEPSSSCQTYLRVLIHNLLVSTIDVLSGAFDLLLSAIAGAFIGLLGGLLLSLATEGKVEFSGLVFLCVLFGAMGGAMFRFWNN